MCVWGWKEVRQKKPPKNSPLTHNSNIVEHAVVLGSILKMLNVRHNPQDILKSYKTQTCSIPSSRCRAHTSHTPAQKPVNLSTSRRDYIFVSTFTEKCDFLRSFIPTKYITAYSLKTWGSNFLIFFSFPSQIWATSPLRCRRKCIRSICPRMASNISGPNSSCCPKTSRCSISAATTCSK